MLNLRTHLDLRSERPSENYRWIQVALDPINRRALVGLCRLIAKKCRTIPFGFSYNGFYFTHAGDYIPRTLGDGLTCATFVMAVFETYSIPILKTEEWPSRQENHGWQAGQVQLIGHARGGFLASAIAAHIGQLRFRPEEVTAGAVSADRPLSFRRAARLGERIRRDLTKSY